MAKKVTIRVVQKGYREGTYTLMIPEEALGYETTTEREKEELAAKAAYQLAIDIPFNDKRIKWDKWHNDVAMNSNPDLVFATTERD